MAVTISVAVVAALVLTLTLIPVLATFLFRRPPGERESPLLRWLRRPYGLAARPVRTAAARCRWPARRSLLVIAGVTFAFLGKEFLPELDEGDVWLRVKFPVGISLEDARPYVHDIRERLLSVPEVRTVVSQLGAPDDGTDPNGPDTCEFYIGLKPREEWATRDKDKVVDAMDRALAGMSGITTNFSQPIKDNVDEALAGVKGELGIKLFGPDVFVLEAKAKEIATILGPSMAWPISTTNGSSASPSCGSWSTARPRRGYGINIQDIEDTLEAATRGRVVGEIFEGERRFNLAVRLAAEDAEPLAALRNLTVSAPAGERVPLTQLAEFVKTEGLAQILREGSQRRIAVKWGVRGRDMGGLVAEAMRKVHAAVDAAQRLPDGVERPVRRPAAGARPPLHHRAAGCLHHLRAAVRRVSVRGHRAADHAEPAVRFDRGHAGPLLLAHELQHLGGRRLHRGLRRQRPERRRARHVDPAGAVRRPAAPRRDRRGCEIRFRAIVVSAIVAVIGFLPAALSHGIGSEIQRPLARVVIGGLISSTVLTLLVLPAIYGLMGQGTTRDRAATAENDQ